MGKLIVKISSRGERSPGVFKFHEHELTVGRAYDNDVVIEDPFLSPHQFRLTHEMDHVLVEVIDSVNPVFVNQRLLEGTSCVLSPGEMMSVGRTQIRVFAQDAQLAPTKRQFMSSWAQPGKISPLVAILTLLICCTVDSLASFFQSSVDLQWREPAYMTLFSAAMLVVWAGVWAVAGRIFKHISLFYVQLFLTSIVSGAFIFVFPLAEFIDFQTNEVLAGEVASYVIATLFLFALLKANLAIATNVQNTTRAALLSSLFLVGLTFAGVRYNLDDFDSEQSYSASVKPPVFLLSRPASIDDYFAKLRDIELAIDADQ